MTSSRDELEKTLMRALRSSHVQDNDRGDGYEPRKGSAVPSYGLNSPQIEASIRTPLTNH